ncbi:MAG TPA: iron uptake system protein EfeO, partial [Jatrophihabitans sp.]|nr:iron uptake system protein EfeO [Jatrophihabitans sp.]
TVHDSRPGEARSTGALSLPGLLAVLALMLAACSGSPNTRPASAAAGDPHTARITITNDRCVADRDSYDAGAITFAVSNVGATGITEFELLSGERIVGEKENLPPGFSGTFSLNLEPGTYQMYCPGAVTARVPLTITGTATSTPASDTRSLLDRGTAGYGTYVERQIGQLLAATRLLATTLRGTDLAAAQAAYAHARPYYERIEPVAESFAGLDPTIDMRADAAPASQLTGFHRIEYGLFGQRRLAGLATVGDSLVANVHKLQALTAGLAFQPAELANGAVELLDEVSRSKITGEEERYSHLDLLDFQANVEGSQQAYANLQPGLQRIDPALTSTIAGAFEHVDQLLDRYRDTSDLSGFVRFSALTAPDKTALAQAVQSVAEPLSRVASKVVGA